MSPAIASICAVTRSAESGATVATPTVFCAVTPVIAASPSLPHGVARLVGPTGGYLMAYPLAAFVAGWLAERGFDRRYVTAFIAMACGLAIVFAGGVLWLAWLGQRPRGLNAALAAGFYPFIVADLLKLLAAAAVMPAAWRLARSRAR